MLARAGDLMAYKLKAISNSSSSILSPFILILGGGIHWLFWPWSSLAIMGLRTFISSRNFAAAYFNLALFAGSAAIAGFFAPAIHFYTFTPNAADSALY